MASINKVILVGNLGRDPEVRHNPDNTTLCNISMATSLNWKDKNTGEQREETEWHRVVLFGRLAEIAGQYLKKGSPAYIEGRLKTRKWQDKNTGQHRYTTEVIAEQMQMLRNTDHDTTLINHTSESDTPKPPNETHTPISSPTADNGDVPF